MSEKVAWACPKCGAEPQKHGKGGRDACRQECHPCEGFLCECESTSEAEMPGHGETQENACENANCYHCAWGGTFPPPPFDLRKLPAWAKKAWAEGWRPPTGWQIGAKP